MIRPVAPEDVAELLAITEAIGFEIEELEALRGMLDEYFIDPASGEHFWIVDDDNGLVSVAYYAPERMTQGTWNLYLIAVRPKFQGKGRGTEMLRYIEGMLRDRGAHLLIVETSGLEEFEPAQAFYRKNGFEQEARIRNFYSAGDNKLIFCKALS